MCCIGWRKPNLTEHPNFNSNSLVNNGERGHRINTTQEANPCGVCSNHGGPANEEMCYVRKTCHGISSAMVSEKSVDRVSSGRPQSFRHPPQKVDNCSERRRRLAWRQKKGTECSSRYLSWQSGQNYGKGQGWDSLKYMYSCRLACHNLEIEWLGSFGEMFLTPYYPYFELEILCLIQIFRFDWFRLVLLSFDLPWAWVPRPNTVTQL